MLLKARKYADALAALAVAISMVGAALLLDLVCTHVARWSGKRISRT